jgi:hypothetical protein
VITARAGRFLGVILVTLCLAPARPDLAPLGTRCPTCKVRTVIYVEDEQSRTDEIPYFRDNCGQLHVHDTSYEELTLYCCACEKTWQQRETPPGCPCGWPEDSFDDPCPAIEGAYVYTNRP